MNKSYKKAFFFDRDNTLIIDKGYTHLKKDLKFLPGVISAIRFLKKKQYLIIVLTNQSGIARGYFKMKDVKIFHKFINHKLKKKNCKIDDFFVCGCHPKYPKKNNDCKCRKPSNFMLTKAIKKWSLKKDNIIMIGDKLSDKLSAEKSKINFFYKSKKMNLYSQIKSILK
ncbi:HAD-IIIA family hydrolase [Candidatus Pelagibacter sp.]|nr:HAD-IIIA family hydrolase [Candidatus Pelagibacter sp.]